MRGQVKFPTETCVPWIRIECMKMLLLIMKEEKVQLVTTKGELDTVIFTTEMDVALLIASSYMKLLLHVRIFSTEGVYGSSACIVITRISTTADRQSLQTSHCT